MGGGSAQIHYHTIQLLDIVEPRITAVDDDADRSEAKYSRVRNRVIDRFDLRKVYSVSTYRAARHSLDEHTAIQENTRRGIIINSAPELFNPFPRSSVPRRKAVGEEKSGGMSSVFDS